MHCDSFANQKLVNLLNEPKSGQEEVCVHFQDLHGFDQVVFADDVLNSDLGALDFAILGRE